jgi:hypothetical protein
MVPCLSVRVDPSRADGFQERLDQLRIGRHRVTLAQREGNAPFTYERNGEGFHLFVYFEELDLNAEELGLGFFPHDEEVGCSGRHTPFGALVVYDPLRPAAPSRRACISTLQIAPALLRNFGVPVPGYMSACDPELLDVSRPGRTLERFSGGGVETPVTRIAPEPFHYLDLETTA